MLETRSDGGGARGVPGREKLAVAGTPAARSALCGARVAPVSGVYRCRAGDAEARDRPQRRRVRGAECGPAAAARCARTTGPLSASPQPPGERAPADDVVPCL